MVVDSKDFPHVKVPGKTEGAVRRYDIMPEYIEHLLGYIDIKSLKPLKIVANPGNGGAGPVLNELAKYLPFEFIKINEIPDGTFPRTGLGPQYRLFLGTKSRGYSKTGARISG